MTHGEHTERSVWGTLADASSPTARFAAHTWSFVALAGPDKGRVWEAASPSLTIGSAATNDIELHDDTVSRHHCQVALRDSRFTIRDMGSTNGTRVDGVFVVEAFLAGGSKIQLGDSELRFDQTQRWDTVSESESVEFHGLAGASSAMRLVFSVLSRVANQNLTCLLGGETGTGKELAARAVHAASDRRRGPFVVVDCGSLNRNLIESELFGHERGAFTGADRARKGAFEEATTGTVFLDEVGELDLDLQPRLLRVLECREVKRLGSNTMIPVDVRVVAATHRDLWAEVGRDAFRRDLYYRLAEVNVRLPALRERAGDIPLLSSKLLAPGTVLSADAVEHLSGRSWPGNVRELRNVLRRASALARGNTLDAAVFEELEVLSATHGSAPSERRGPVTTEVDETLPLRSAREKWSVAMERTYVERVMARFGEDVDGAAAHMGIHRKSVLRLLREHGLPNPVARESS